MSVKFNRYLSMSFSFLQTCYENKCSLHWKNTGNLFETRVIDKIDFLDFQDCRKMVFLFFDFWIVHVLRFQMSLLSSFFRDDKFLTLSIDHPTENFPQKGSYIFGNDYS